MKIAFSKVSLCLCFAAILAGSRLVCAGAAFTLTPNTVSNTYAGAVTLQVTGLTTGASVVVQKYLDVNADGIVDAGDQLVQQFNLTDGQAGMVINGVTNINVPGDTDSVAGQITATLDFLNGDIAQNFIGQYLYVVSSASANFAVTNLFTVTNYPFPQKFTGTVFSNGTSTILPYAAVLLFPPPRAGHHDLGQPVGATLANGSGNFAIQMPTGTYSFLASRGNYVYDVSTTPVLALTNGATVTANLTLSSATATITGRVVDSTTTSLGLPGVFMDVGNSSGLIGLGSTDTNGNFTAGVTSGTWQVEANSGLIVHGYAELDNSPSFSSGSTGVSIAYQKGSALFYGTVKDNLGNPLPGVAIEAYDNNNSGNRTYDTDGYSDANGNYVAVAVGGLGPNDVWDVDVDHASSLSNYLFSQSPLGQNGNNGTNLPPGYVVPQNFTAILATNQISGYVLSNGVAGISGVGVFAIATNGGISYSANVDTDNSGYYALAVPNGNWDVSVNCNGGSDSLSSLGLYQCPNDTNINVANTNVTATFDVQAFTTFISGRVLNDAGGPVTNMNLFAFPDGNGSYYQATTDSGGNYTMGIVGGSYTMQLNNDPNSGFPALGLVGPTVPVTVTNGDDITNFILVAPRVTGAIRVQVNNPSDVGDSGIGVFANLMRGATNYGTEEITTDGSGAATLPVFNGTWSVSLDGNDVQNQGYNSPASQNATILHNTNTVTFNLSANNNPLQINTASLPNGTNGVYYSQSFQASGGQPPYTWALALASANPPANLTLGTNGVISGTPSATPNTYYFNVQVTDSAMNTVEQDEVSITIVNASQPLTITNVSLPNGNVGVPYSVQLGASGGQPTYTWALALGSANPPPGLTLYSSGLISGTPTTNGLTSFKAQVTDSAATVVKKVFGIIINPQPVLSLPNWLTNRFQMQLAGGSNQNYTVLVSSNLTTWSTLLVTNNPTTNSFLVTDPHATNQERAYRVLIGP